MTFSHKLKALRQRKKLTQREAAKQIHGMPVSTLRNYEQGRTEPEPWVKKLIVEKLHRG